MAAPAGVTFLSPRKIWAAFTALMAVLFLVLGATLWRMHREQNERLLATQLDTLTRSRIADLESANYRAFVEGIGKDFADTYTEIRKGDAVFSVGAEARGAACVERVAMGTTLRMCRSSQFPWLSMTGLFVVFALVSWGFLRVASALERRTLRGLHEFFERSGVKVETSSGLRGILLRMAEIQRELDRAKEREVTLAERNAVAQVAAQVVHDIRSPLSVLYMVTDRLTDVPGEYRELLRGAIHRIREMSETLLTRYREQASAGAPPSLGMIDLSIAVPVETLVREIVAEKQVQYPGHEITCIVCEETSDTQVVAQRGRLSRVLSNLIDNAVEAGEGRAVVSIALSRIGEDGIAIDVADKGKGIAPDILPRVTEEGFSHGKQKGTGLGLHFTKTMVEGWGGTLEIESKLNEGTRVRLALRDARRHSPLGRLPSTTPLAPEAARGI